MSANDPNQTHPPGGGQGAEGGPQHHAEGGAQERERGGQQRQQQQASHGRRRGGGGSGGGGGRQPQRGQGGGGQQQQRRGESTLNLDELRELTELFSEHGLTDFEFENADIRIRLTRNLAPSAPQPAPAAPPAPAPAPAPAPEPAAPARQPEPPTQPEAPAPEDLHVITSPIVGTFYRAASPTSEPFVVAGSRVEPVTVVCIIEAMKLMNEIQAETTGTVEKIYVENGQPVEYGQPLFGVKK